MEIKSPSRPFEKLNEGVKFKMENNYLEHYGTKGQKWGIRRYQYKDGTLTPLGRKRLEKLERERSKLLPKSKQLEEKAPAKKSVKDLSDEELRSTINRLQMEKQLTELTKQPETKKGKSVVGQILSKSGQAAASTLTTAAFTYLGKQAIKNMAGEKVYKEMFNIKDGNKGKKD